MFAVVFLPLDARAGTNSSKYFFNFFWPGNHWEAQDFQPYFQDPVMQQNTSFRNDDWKPQHWVNGSGGAKAVIDQFFKSGLLVEQDETCEGVAELEVGEAFLHLSAQEKTRIAQFVDYAYNITSDQGVYYLTYRDEDNVIGVYTRNGLQLH